MYELRYWLAKLHYKLKKNDKEVMNNYFRKAGMKIGKGCNICCNIMTPEPYLISIGDNTTIAGNVSLITHDNSVSKVIAGTTDFFAPIKIGSNCFIGSNSTILYGVTLTNNIIVAAGSVVANSFDQERIVIAGNPARVVSTWDKYVNKNQKFAFDVSGKTDEEKKAYILDNPQKYVSR